MSDSSGSAGGQGRGSQVRGLNMASRSNQTSLLGNNQNEEQPSQQRVSQMTAEERQQWEEDNPGEYGPGTVIEEETGRVFLRMPDRQEGTFSDILAPAYTRERLSSRRQPRQPSGRNAPERTTGRTSGGGRSGSTTLLTPEGLGRSQSGRTVLGV